MDILDKLRQKNREQGDIIDQLYAKQPKTRPIVPQVDEATKRALTVKSLRESGSAGGAFLADIGATLNKAIPNLKRVINPNDKEALEELKEIEDTEDTEVAEDTEDTDANSIKLNTLKTLKKLSGNVFSVFGVFSA